MLSNKMSFVATISFLAMSTVISLSYCGHILGPETGGKGRAYYFDTAGNDNHDGSKKSPLQTIAKLNSLRLRSGDTILFAAGQTFNGSILIDSADAGDSNRTVLVSSYGNGKAIINGGNITALTIHQHKFIHISNLSFLGSGRKSGNTKDGVIISNCSNIVIDSIEVKGFQKAGLLVNSSTNAEIKNVYAADNGFAGIYATGQPDKKDCSNIHIVYCKAANNPGDPTNLTNHSGNGILAGYCRKILIEYCSANSNGWDMPRKGNGPVGIWCFEADSVVIQHCISYQNKTAPGAADGGGYDLDGGVTNSVIQYCLSYENQGSGYGLFQYAGAGNWNNNTVRYCISENDGSVSPAHAGVFIWNGSGDSTQLANCFFYNNTVYNAKGAAISYEALSANKGFRFYNNIFVAKDSLVIGRTNGPVYLGNNWYSLNGGFVNAGFSNFQKWVNAGNKEKNNHQIAGFNIDPVFQNPGHAVITDPLTLDAFNNYQLPAGSPLRNSGLDLHQLLMINDGGKTFNGTAANSNGIGATD